MTFGSPGSNAARPEPASTRRTAGHQEPEPTPGTARDQAGAWAARPPLWRELAIGLILFGCYSLVANLSSLGRDRAAERKGRAILDFERAAHISWDETLNHWIVPHHVLRIAANYEYAYTYILSALILVAWLYVRRPETYRWARNSFLVMNVLAFICFVVYPVTPPRLLVGEGFVDTVTLGHTVGSWGTPLVGHANQLAAMPSLHIAWAVWVSVVLACVSGAKWVQGVSALHVLVTALVIFATANHYVSDALGGIVVVWLTLGIMAIVQDRPGRWSGPRVAAADAFFLHVETPAAPQHVGGVIMMIDEPDGAAYQRRLRAGIGEHLSELPRFRQVLAPSSRWRRPRWHRVDELDWDWHVPLVDLSRPDGRPGGMAALEALVAEVQSTPLPRDRPLWRWMSVTGFADGKAAGLFVMHHSVADGIGTVMHAFKLIAPQPPPLTADRVAPRRLRRALAVVVGLAQLATDGRPRRTLPSGNNAERRYAMVPLPLATARAVARGHGVRVSDVLLSAVAGGLRRVRGGDDLPSMLRVAVTLTVRVPDTSAEGNSTAAVMTDVPLGPMSELDRLTETARRTGPLHTGTRALASRFVMDSGTAVLPPPAQAWFARTVYGSKYFQAIVSNMPGPPGVYRMAGGLMTGVFPLLPLAPGSPLAVGVLGWDANLCVGVTVDPELFDDAQKLARTVRQIVEDLIPAEQPTAETVGDAESERAGSTAGGASGGHSG